MDKLDRLWFTFRTPLIVLYELIIHLGLFLGVVFWMIPGLTTKTYGFPFVEMAIWVASWFVLHRAFTYRGSQTEVDFD
jgi:hypothetical protein